MDLLSNMNDVVPLTASVFANFFPLWKVELDCVLKAEVASK